MSKLTKAFFVVTILLFGIVIQTYAQALPTLEIIYEPFHEQNGDKFVVVKWKADKAATQSKLLASYKNPDTNANVEINNSIQPVTVSAITETNPVTNNVTTTGKEFSTKIPFGINKLLVESTPNFTFQVMPFGPNSPNASAKFTGSILINMNLIRNYFKLQNDLSSQKTEFGNKSKELEKVNGENVEKQQTIDKLNGIIGNFSQSTTPKFEIVDVTDVTHKSVGLSYKN